MNPKDRRPEGRNRRPLISAMKRRENAEREKDAQAMPKTLPAPTTAKQAGAKKASWRDVLTVHPACELFPPMSRDELPAFGEDISKRGLISPIVLWSPGAEGDGQPVFLLDGRNRLDAIEAAGLCLVKSGKLDRECIRSADWTVLYERVRRLAVVGGVRKTQDTPGTNPWDYALSANLHRRHLTLEQKRKLIAALIKQQPQKSDRQISKATGVSHPTVAKIRTKLEGAGDVEKITTSIDSQGRVQPKKKRRPEVGLRTEQQQEPIVTTSTVEQVIPQAAEAPTTSRYVSLLDAWHRASPDDRRRFLRTIGAVFIEAEAVS
jgi:hypothetical protein